MDHQYYQWEPSLYFWQDEAACKDADPKLFMFLEGQSQDSIGLNHDERIRINYENHEDAKSYCDRCPVLLQCRESATEDDLDWTVRAGMSPRAFSGRPVGRPSNRDRDVCANGHRKVAGQHCMKCRSEQAERYRDRQRANRAAVKAGRPLPYPDVKQNKRDRDRAANRLTG